MNGKSVGPACVAGWDRRTAARRASAAQFLVAARTCPYPRSWLRCVEACPLALIRRSAASLAALADRASVAEVMFEQILHHQLQPRPSPGERRAWERSIPVLAHDLVQAGLGDVEVLLEHRLPLASRRADAILAGCHPVTRRPSYVVVELKQWSTADVYEDDPGLVTIEGYGHHPILHPVEQVRGYCEYLLDFLPALQDDDSVAGAAYLHNAAERAVAPLRRLPESDHGRLFTGDRKGDFLHFLGSRLAADVPGAPYADTLLASAARPSRQLLAVAADEIRRREQFVLLDQQRLAYNMVLHATEAARASDAKTVVIVSGGPGSGKSVIALSLLGELARQGRAVLHATGSRSFTQTLRQVTGRGSPRTKQLFKYFNQFTDACRNGLEVLILDEAHRIRETSASQFTAARLRTGQPQVDELIAAARVPVFLLDHWSGAAATRPQTGRLTRTRTCVAEPASPTWSSGASSATSTKSCSPAGWSAPSCTHLIGRPASCCIPS